LNRTLTNPAWSDGRKPNFDLLDKDNTDSGRPEIGAQLASFNFVNPLIWVVQSSCAFAP
jgi:hypothetical protein